MITAKNFNKMTVFELAADWSWQRNFKGFKLIGGKAIYTDAIFNSRRNGANTYIGRLETMPEMKLKQIGRYVPNSTEVILIDNDNK